MPSKNLEDKELANVYLTASAALGELWNAAGSIYSPDFYQQLSQTILHLCFLFYSDNSGFGLPVKADVQAWEYLKNNPGDPDYWRIFNDLWLSLNADEKISDLMLLRIGCSPSTESLISIVKRHARERPFSPSFTLGAIQQAILDNEPSPENPVILRRSIKKRKTHGAFYTPSSLILFSVNRTLAKFREGLPRILDPACGSGAFLSGAANYLASFETDQVKSKKKRAEIICNYVYGIESDFSSAEAARLSLWLEVGDPELPLDFLDNKIVCADFLNGYRSSATTETKNVNIEHQLGLMPNGVFSWEKLFPEVFKKESDGFDAVIGNPPYVATKNQNLRHYEEEWGIRGQSDLYILFIVALARNSLIRHGGRYGFVLPDPVLARENAEPARKLFLQKYGLDTILHVRGLFSGAVVANAILSGVSGAKAQKISCARIDSIDAAAIFWKSPEKAFQSRAVSVDAKYFLQQPKMEMPYIIFNNAEAYKLVENTNGKGKIIGNCKNPFVRLGDMTGVDIFRGEEIGKAAIRSCHGELPILLGGQSISSYKINWEGHKISRQHVKKPLEGYHSAKILVQKSAPRPVAAVDYPFSGHPGFIVPQSVYCIRLPEENTLFYVAGLLNSEVIGNYVYSCFTGYKLLHPQIEIEDLKRIPIRICQPLDDNKESETLVLQGVTAVLSGSAAYFCKEMIEANKASILASILTLAARDATFNGNFKSLIYQTETIVRALYGLDY